MKMNKLLYCWAISILEPTLVPFEHYITASMAIRSRHPFHLVDNSPWPIISALFSLGLTTGGVRLMYYGRGRRLGVALLGLLIVRAQWWRDISREAASIGEHVRVVELGIRWGVILFIISEVFFFVSFFWAFFYSRLAPSPELGAT